MDYTDSCIVMQVKRASMDGLVHIPPGVTSLLWSVCHAKVNTFTMTPVTSQHLGKGTAPLITWFHWLLREHLSQRVGGGGVHLPYLR